MQLRLVAAAALAAGLLAAAPGVARAYPQWQLSTGNARCSLCHISPVGGGLINDYGRGESGDTISQFGGNGDWLYGAYKEPEWMKLGVDLRFAGLAKDQATEPSYHLFPMQGDTYSFFRYQDWSFYSVLGVRAEARNPKSSFADRLDQAHIIERFGSREYWFMWCPKTTGWYARAGRFFVPYGLRLADHTAYVRRYLGFNSWEEPLAISGGKVASDWEAHASAFTRMPDELQGNGMRHTGAAGYFEKRLGADENMLVGAETKVGFGDLDRLYLAGGVGKYYIDAARVLLMSQLDVGYQDFTFGAKGRPQLGFYGGASWWPFTGLMVGSAYHRFDEDMSVKHTTRDAIELTLQYFPLAHFELNLLGRLEWQGDYGDPSDFVMLQLHYYL